MIIGLGIADRLVAAGAAVVLSDIDESCTQKPFATTEAGGDKPHPYN